MAMQKKSDIRAKVTDAVNAFYKLSTATMQIKVTRVNPDYSCDRVTTFDIQSGYIDYEGETHAGYAVLVRTTFKSALPDMYAIETVWECPDRASLITAITDTLYAGRNPLAYVVFDKYIME